MTRLLGVLVGLITAILCWLAFPSSAGALVPAHPHATYTYDAPVYDAAGNDSVQERGPPGLAVARTTYDAVGLRSHGASARPDGPARGVTTIYTHLAPLVQVAQTSTTTGDRVVVAHGDLSSFQRSVSAANGGNRVFWSGGDVAKNAAADYAKANGGKTLEMTLTGRALEKIPYNRFTKPVTGKLWDLASWRFARSARGDAHVFFGPNAPRPGSVFARIEGPILDRRGNSILQHFLE